MKIAIVDASISTTDAPGRGLSDTSALAKIISETLSELGEELVHIRLERMRLPFYCTSRKTDDGTPSPLRDAVYEVMAAAGAIFITPSLLCGPSAMMSAFLEYFCEPQFRQGLLDKNCMTVTSGDVGAMRGSLEYLSRVIGALGGYDPVRTAVPAAILQNGADDEALYLIEKQTEDYYRILRQNRKFYALGDFASGDFNLGGERKAISGAAPADSITDESFDPSAIERLRQMRERVSSNTFTDEQEGDIAEISKLMAARFGSPAKQSQPNLRPRQKTCRQMTTSLPHYFNPQLAAGLRMSMMIQITGEETFQGTLIVDNSQCAFDENPRENNSEITVISDAKIWRDILCGKYTAQKAFMTGQLKVRGNFLLLTKFDQLFNKMDA